MALQTQLAAVQPYGQPDRPTAALLDSLRAARSAGRLPSRWAKKMKTAIGLILVSFACGACATGATETQVIDVAKKHLAEKCTPTLPCTFKATRESDGWRIFVEFTKMNSPDESPFHYPGGHRLLFVNDNGKVVRVFYGE